MSAAVRRAQDMALVGASARSECRRGDLSEVGCFYRLTRGHIAHDCLKRKCRSKSWAWVAAIAAGNGSDSEYAICLVGDANDDGDIAKSLTINSAASAHM